MRAALTGLRTLPPGARSEDREVRSEKALVPCSLLTPLSSFLVWRSLKTEYPKRPRLKELTAETNRIGPSGDRAIGKSNGNGRLFVHPITRSPDHPISLCVSVPQW